MLKESFHTGKISKGTFVVDSLEEFSCPSNSNGGSYEFTLNKRHRVIIWRTKGKTLELTEYFDSGKKNVQILFKSDVLPSVYFNQVKTDLVMTCCTRLKIFHKFVLSFFKSEKYDDMSLLNSISDSESISKHHTKKVLSNIIQENDAFIFRKVNPLTFAIVTYQTSHVHLISFSDHSLLKYTHKIVNQKGIGRKLVNFLSFSNDDNFIIDVTIEKGADREFMFILFRDVTIRVFDSNSLAEIMKITVLNDNEMDKTKTEFIFSKHSLKKIIINGILYIIVYYYERFTKTGKFVAFEIAMTKNSNALKHRRKSEKCIKNFDQSEKIMVLKDYIVTRKGNKDGDVNVYCIIENELKNYELIYGTLILVNTKKEILKDDKKRKGVLKKLVSWNKMESRLDVINTSLFYPFNGNIAHSSFHKLEVILTYFNKHIILNALKTQDLFKSMMKTANIKYDSFIIMDDHQILEFVRAFIGEEVKLECSKLKIDFNDVKNDLKIAKVRHVLLQKFFDICRVNWLKMYSPNAFFSFEENIGLINPNGSTFIRPCTSLELVYNNDGFSTSERYELPQLAPELWTNDDANNIDVISLLRCVEVTINQIGECRMFNLDKQIENRARKGDEMSLLFLKYLNGMMNEKCVISMDVNTNFKDTFRKLWRKIENPVLAVQNLYSVIQKLDQEFVDVDTNINEFYQKRSVLFKPLVCDVAKQLIYVRYKIYRDIVVFMRFLTTQKEVFLSKNVHKIMKEEYLSYFIDDMIVFFRMYWLSNQMFETIMTYKNRLVMVPECHIDHNNIIEDIFHGLLELKRYQNMNLSHVNTFACIIVDEVMYNNKEYSTNKIFEILLASKQYHILSEFVKFIDEPVVNHYAGFCFVHKGEIDRAIECFMKVATLLTSEKVFRFLYPNKKKIENDLDELLYSKNALDDKSIFISLSESEKRNYREENIKKKQLLRDIGKFRYYLDLIKNQITGNEVKIVQKFGILALETLNLSKRRYRHMDITFKVINKLTHDRSLLSSQLFSSYMQSGRYRDAYHSVMENNIRENQMRDLRVFLRTLCEKGEGCFIVEQSYVGKEDLIIHVLHNMARESNPVSQVMKFSFYEVLYSFLIRRDNFAHGSQIMYEYYIRIEEVLENERKKFKKHDGKKNIDDVLYLEYLCKQREALVNSIHSLGLIKKENMYFIFPKFLFAMDKERERKKKEEEDICIDEGDEDVLGDDDELIDDMCENVVVMKDIERDYVKVEGTIDLLRNSNYGVFELLGRTNEQLVVMMIEKELHNNAFSLAKKCDMDKKVMFRLMTMIAMKTELNLKYDQNVRSMKWAYLKKFLRKYDTIENYQVVFFTIFELDKNFKPSDWIVHDMRMKCPSEMLRTYLSFNLIDEAIETLDAYLKMKDENTIGSKVYMSWSLIDKLMDGLKKDKRDEDHEKLTIKLDVILVN